MVILASEVTAFTNEHDVKEVLVIDDDADTCKKRKRGRSQDDEKADIYLKKLRVMDPGTISMHYWISGPGPNNGRWDLEALQEDVNITERYIESSLEVTMSQMRSNMQVVLSAKRRDPKVGAVRDSTEIVPGLILGNAKAARDVDLLRSHGVRTVINLSPQTVRTNKAFYDEAFDGLSTTYMEIWADDMADYCILDHFEDVWGAYLDIRNLGKGAVFIHCEQGVNRSGALAMAVYMRNWYEQNAEMRKCASTLLFKSWSNVCEQRGGGRALVTNTSFQRQLLLFARLECRWWTSLPSICGIWRTPHERAMCNFRSFAVNIARTIVGSLNDVGVEHLRYLTIMIRDGVMRHEGRLKTEDKASDKAPEPFNIGQNVEKVERRIQAYAKELIEKKIQFIAEGV